MIIFAVACKVGSDLNGWTCSAHTWLFVVFNLWCWCITESSMSLSKKKKNLVRTCCDHIVLYTWQIIPESLTARLLNVIVLDVHSNQLKCLPNSIGCLSKLKILNVSGNLLQSLPRTIENCRLVHLLWLQHQHLQYSRLIYLLIFSI